MFIMLRVISFIDYIVTSTVHNRLLLDNLEKYINVAAGFKGLRSILAAGIFTCDGWTRTFMCRRDTELAY